MLNDLFEFKTRRDTTKYQILFDCESKSSCDESKKILLFLYRVLKRMSQHKETTRQRPY